ncbi:pyridoxal-phosphate dependent enzyme [Staphylococcus epidermidis]|uniref:pyridoxal-phosphate dependent enzyme n=1 Tax=Staphylococcus epidermidis TaxID=1282 RepID=UPI0019318EF6|nr:pyridoxal-phosphate dependent enzyme [Staphylococcus epidermidis]MBM0871343.1 pyridoxal-phosphate dependent enzyme [Staphylococcus epidermidis]MBM0873261.1 pyridoxal-phosphate dependent enzyme [Staphylococcus epidermidis]MCO6203519.1 pyridoxal-phosphate dependent enzyme [Staphylococcus epidermidis]MCO6286869.1 pyridoxal-phosphate dependent enzyme [Staphylococcus epidermidis]MCO6323305.1 pyridoxal-phosphate dependent enzyme [Staphylococcus epidermidis]
MIHNSLEDLIGNTPILSIKGGLVPYNKELLLKLEYFNPNFSIKDRTALGLIKYSIENGNLRPGDIIIESTSGNLGKSLAMFGASKNFEVILIVDPKIDKSLLNMYKAYGATVITVTEKDDKGGYQKTRINKVKDIINSNPEKRYFWPNQYENIFNQKYHYQITSNEFLNISTDFITSPVSTGGHLSGIAEKMKELNKKLDIIGADVRGSCIFENNPRSYLLNGVGLSWKSNNLKEEYLDWYSIVSDDLAISICRYFSENYGLLIGGSAGLSIATALKALQTNKYNKGLAIVPDTGINYLNQIYDDKWVSDNAISLKQGKELHESINEIKIKEV